MNINNDIQESYCSFEVSKLLKDKGFDRPKPCFLDGWFKEEPEHYDELLNILFGNEKYEKEVIWKPTHALAIEWIRVNFGIWIYVSPCMDIENDWAKLIPKTFSFMYQISSATEAGYVKAYNKPIIWEKGFTTPQAATEAALLYTLQKLIK